MKIQTFKKQKVIAISSAIILGVSGMSAAAVNAVNAQNVQAVSSVDDNMSDESLALSGDVQLDAVNFPDEAFRNYIAETYDTDKNGVLSAEEIQKVNEISLTDRKEIKDVTGISFFPELRGLRVGGTSVTSLDVSKNEKLQYLGCFNTGLTVLDLSNNPELMYLLCSDSSIEKMDLRGTQIKELDLSTCKQLSDLVVTDMSALTNLNVSNTNITSLDFAGCENLYELDATGSKLSNLDISTNTNLVGLRLEATQLNTLDISNNPALQFINVSNTNLTALDVSKNTGLLYLFLNNTPVTSLDVSKNTALKTLQIDNVPLSSLEIGINEALQIIQQNVSSTSLSSIVSLNVQGSSFALKDSLPNVDSAKIESITGATLQDGIVTDYEPGRPICYTYVVSEGKQQVKLNVTLNLMITNVWDTQLTVSDMIYGQAMSVHAQPAFGTVSYVFSDSKDGEYKADIPQNAGEYWVKAVVAGEEGLEAMESEPQMFKILPKDASQVTVPEINHETNLDNFIIRDNDKVLTQGIDYTISETTNGNNKEVTITFMGNYTGTIIRSYPVADSETVTGGTSENDRNQDDNNPSTGDVSATGLWASVLAATAGIAAIFAGKRKKKAE